MRTTHEAVGAGGLTENLKKGVTEMLVLSLLDVRPMNIHEILRMLDEKSNAVCKISYPYAIIYRLSNSRYIRDCGKLVADDRLRSYYEITDSGRAHLDQMKEEYRAFIAGVESVFASLVEEKADQAK